MTISCNTSAPKSQVFFSCIISYNNGTTVKCFSVLILENPKNCRWNKKNSDMFLLLTTYLIDGELIHDFLAHILIVKPKKGQSLKRKALEKNWIVLFIYYFLFRFHSFSAFYVLWTRSKWELWRRGPKLWESQVSNFARTGWHRVLQRPFKALD